MTASRTRLAASLLGLLLVGLPGLAAAAPSDAKSAEGSFLAENRQAMDRMMAAMNVKPTGDVDVDFVAMMVPHHQGAVDMARAVLRYGKNEQIRRLAQEIIVEQPQEIAAMRLAVGQPLPPSAAAPDQPITAASPTAPSATPHHHPKER